MLNSRSVIICLKQIGLYLGVILLVAYSVGPITLIFTSSFRLKQDFFDFPPTIFPKTWTLENYVGLLKNTSFPQWFLNSLIICILVIIFTVVIGILAAYSLARLAFPGRNLFSLFSLFAYMLPQILMVIPLYLWAMRLGLANTKTGLIIAYIALCLPYSIWLLRSFIKTVPKSLEEAAFIDGAGYLKTLISVVVPMSIPGIISTTVYAFTYVWNEYLFALVFINSDRNMMFPVGLQGMIGHHDIYWEYILTGSVIVSIPALIIFLFAQRSLIKGLGAGAVKG